MPSIWHGEQCCKTRFQRNVLLDPKSTEENLTQVCFFSRFAELLSASSSPQQTGQHSIGRHSSCGDDQFFSSISPIHFVKCYWPALFRARVPLFKLDQLDQLPAEKSTGMVVTLVTIFCEQIMIAV